MAISPDPDNVQQRLRKTRIGQDLLARIQEQDGAMALWQGAMRQPVVIEMNADFPGGSGAARLVVLGEYLREVAVEADSLGTLATALVAQASAVAQPASKEALFGPDDRLDIAKSAYTGTYLFGELTAATIARLSEARVAAGGGMAAPVYKIWADHPIERCVFQSVRTTKCDAGRAAFAAWGEGIVWAVADTGIDGAHPHFATHGTLKLPGGLRHVDFTQTWPTDAAAEAAALQDTDGHGTHVAGIVAGETPFDPAAPAAIAREVLDGNGDPQPVTDHASVALTGMAPRARLLSLKVLQTGRSGAVSTLLAAIGYIQTQNDNGRNLRIHGVNMSLGYLFNPEWYAAGASPLCVEVDRLVRSGVMVVVAAGNGGYGSGVTYVGGRERMVLGGTINDPGNAALALTVGSTHREKPHTYGVSYFSAKGPTADGRAKPDLVAPGERIVSCALGGGFREDSGTSMAAPHVSGAAAAFLSVRGEFVGQPERLKSILTQSATDLGRRPVYQGAGLSALRRALHSFLYGGSPAMTLPSLGSASIARRVGRRRRA